MGGNGILLDYDAVRFFADAEAMYTFEGTREANTLIVGRALTYSAFTRGNTCAHPEPLPVQTKSGSP